MYADVNRWRMQMDRPKNDSATNQLVDLVQAHMPGSPLEKVGAFILSWALFEHFLETAIWRLSNETPAGIRPSTDDVPASARIRRFRTFASLSPSNEWQILVKNFCDTAENLSVIRNSLVHGHMALGGMINNPRWHQELRRKSSHCLDVSELSMTMVTDAMFTLLVSARLIALDDAEPQANQKLFSLATALGRANQYSGEIRFLDQIMNNEKN